jgi:curved DNA-binding protein CbpA
VRASDDPFALLGLTRSAGADEIRAAYRRAAKTAHPDKGGSSEAFRRIQMAADLLLSELQTRDPSEPEGAYRDGDRTSAGGDWDEVAGTLRSRWGRSPIIVFPPAKLGLSPFVTHTTLNAPAYAWLVRTLGPRGEGWDFHVDGSQARLFFRRADDARLFKLKFS